MRLPAKLHGFFGNGGNMSEENKNEEIKVAPDENDPGEMQTRRDFLRSLGKWSAIIIGGAALGGIVGTSNAAGWVNGGGGWINARGGGGGAAWVNRVGGGVGWVNRAGGWVNGIGGGGGSWVNARGGGGGGAWINRR